MRVVAFDPGLTGAVAIVSDSGDADVRQLPTLGLGGDATVSRRIDGHALAEMIADMLEPEGMCSDEDFFTVCESVHAFGTDEKSVTTLASLLRSLGAIEAVCDLLGCPAQLVPPRTWQTFFGLVAKRHEGRARGALPESVLTARRLYPCLTNLLHRVSDHNAAEAVLIGHYALRKLQPLAA